MKAITILQPYAHLIASGEKRVENRSWPTKYRGLIAIHAGQGRAYLDKGDLELYPDMSFGAVVATATLVDCVDYYDLLRFAAETNRPWLIEDEHAVGPVCWILEAVERLEEPVPCSGAQRLWNFQDDTK